MKPEEGAWGMQLNKACSVHPRLSKGQETLNQLCSRPGEKAGGAWGQGPGAVAGVGNVGRGTRGPRSWLSSDFVSGHP